MTENPRILVVDDSRESLELIGLQLESKYQATLVSSLREAREKLTQCRYHIAIVDLVLPGENGLDLIREISSDYPYTAVIAISGQASIESAVMAMKLGASEFMVKPLRNPDLINILVEKTLQAQWLIAENRRLNAMLNNELDTDLIIGNSQPIQALIQKVKKISKLDTLALITGETGVGKSVFAELIHRNSPRRSQKFVSVNCGSLTETLLESLLFGHKRGAFTDATRDKVGYFQEANGGTLFLDEITETSLVFQVKLLKVLETGIYRAVGSDSDSTTDTRIIAATNKDIEAMVKENKFREDLYYRLNVINLHIPPLRERKDDIRVLANSFVHEFCKKYNKTELKVSPGVMSLLLKYKWKGNIRELRNALEHAVILAENKVIQPEDLPEAVSGGATSAENIGVIDNLNWAEARDAFTKHYIQSLLLKTGGNILRAAALADITRENFYKKCTKLGIDWRQYRNPSEYDNGGEI
ncbi:MAG: sigma-54 dependent transcriptional regulator [Candidatus Cloacimonetes bacterium]|nr:sigma-54 dependent transcriptional regulator [Candidatus Cloacimonadota bacterium]MDD4687899.1 sigma-54 dependent transcriptional regulator [Candidatus Cloacimonadota bacterium]